MVSVFTVSGIGSIVSVTLAVDALAVLVAGVVL